MSIFTYIYVYVNRYLCVTIMKKILKHFQKCFDERIFQQFLLLEIRVL